MIWQADLIRLAAEAEDKTVDELLADRRLFVLDDADRVEFQARLRAPARPTPVLQELFARDEGPWA